MTENILIKKEGDLLEAQNRLKEFLSQLPKKIELPTVETKGLFLAHKVTGEEMNALVDKLQDYLADVKNENIKTFEEFLEIYKYFEVQNKEYLTAIRGSVKTAEEASNQAMKAQSETKKIIKTLLSFQAELRSLKHLKEIDTLYEDLRELKKTIDEIKAFRIAIEEQVNFLKKELVFRENNTKKQIHSIKSGMDIYEAKCQSIKMQCRIAIVIAGISLITLIVIAFVR